MNKFLIILLLTFQNSFCQNFSTENINNSASIEISGHSESIISINYERLFTNYNSKFIYLLGIGVGRNPGADKESNIRFPATTSLPVFGGVLFGKRDHFAQIKFGYTPIFSKNFIDTSLEPNVVYKKFQSDYSLSLGYRFMSNSGIVAQGFPIFIWKQNPNEKFKISFGVSLGYAF
ncbi:hypothetical protein [Flavobacterium terrae]|uniref:Outer membrane protein beta-barrel domain-containing protein n=1 Tax=Flavobacterium terrae TaxID=415425 RepID=A0A1M6D2B0_9FLAO|nr:hypothetical protein [Flavobacterium terrae]SHI67329.1 hypothetical protein SAMN05444363_1214 [Flavobacterium terrae]